MGWRSLLALAVFGAACALAGCQGAGGLTQQELASQPAVEPEAPDVLPAFPIDEIGPAIPRITADQDNYLLGKDVWDRADSGALIAGNDLGLTSGTGDYTWGVWRWGVFGTGILPETLRVECTVGEGNEYWLLLSDYDSAAWEVHGPLDVEIHAQPYDAGVDYTSPAGYTYAALLVAGGNAVDANRLNLISDEDVTPPAAPLDLVIDDILATSVDLGWTANSEPDLDGYNVYSGPTSGFSLDDPGVVDRGQAGAAATGFVVYGLTPEQTYHFRITAVDITGGESPPSNSVMAEMPAEGTVDPPTDLTVDDIGGSWVDLSWTPPTNPAPIGYEFYTGPAADFSIGGPGVVKRSEALVTGSSWQMTGLQGETEYYCRARAYYLGSKWSELSEAANFTTTENIPPVPGFLISPLYPRVSELVSFNPSPTTDADTPTSELTFNWDFDGDDVVDDSTTGPSVVHYTYPLRGPYNAKLTVSDGTPVETTKTIVVGYQQDYECTAAGGGSPANLLALDADPADGRIAAVVQSGAERTVRLYTGGSWQTVSTSTLSLAVIADVTLSPGGLSLLTADTGSGGTEWTVYSHNGTDWSAIATQPIASESFQSGDLDVSVGGQIGVAVIGADPVGEEDSHNNLEIWHEKADSTFVTDSYTGWPNNHAEAMAVRRTETTSYFVYGQSGNLRLWEYTDSADSATTAQTYTGVLSSMFAGQDPADSAHVFWAATTDGGDIVYGDNYGTANGAQSYTPAVPATALLGAGLVGDNEGLFFWYDEDADSVQHLRGYDTTAGGGSGQLYTIVTGIGSAGGGGGAYYDDGVSEGVYTALNEARDGEVSGRFIVDGAVERTDDVFGPQGSTNIEVRHRPVIFGDDSLLCLSQQVYATAFGAHATAAGEAYTFGNVGDDTWCIPDAACRTAVSDEFFVASYTQQGILELNRFTYGSSVGTQEGFYTDTTLAQLEYSSSGGESLLCYRTNGSVDLAVRTWSGAAWSTETTVHSGAESIVDLTAADAPGGEWGIALVDAADNLLLYETSGGVWGSAETLSAGDLNESAGIGLDYHADGHLGVAVERNSAEPGIYLGLRPDGGSLSWSRISETPGDRSRYLYAFYLDTSPVVLFYRIESPVADSRMHTVIERAGEWGTTTLDFQMHGTPVGAAMDSAGNIVLCGYSRSMMPRQAAVAILYE